MAGLAAAGATTDADGHVTRYTYDSVDRLSSTTDAAGGS